MLVLGVLQNAIAEKGFVEVLEFICASCVRR